MSTISNIVLADATPANRTFVPTSREGNVATFTDRVSQSTIAGQSTIVIDYSPASAGRSTDRIKVRLNLPKVVVVSGVDTVVSTARFDGNGLIVPSDWTTTERNHFVTLVKNLMATTQLINLVKDRDAILG